MSEELIGKRVFYRNPERLVSSRNGWIVAGVVRMRVDDSYRKYVDADGKLHLILFGDDRGVYPVDFDDYCFEDEAKRILADFASKVTLDDPK